MGTSLLLPIIDLSSPDKISTAQLIRRVIPRKASILALWKAFSLNVCRDKSKQPHIWEDVPGISGAFIVNIGDMMERWTNGLFRSTLHRVMPVGKERYSVVFFLDPNPDCNVECLESCCSETCPPRNLRKLLWNISYSNLGYEGGTL